MVTVAASIVRFADRRTAYSFVAELRRLYELDRFVGLAVLAYGREILVDLPSGAPPASELTDIVARHGGHMAAGPEELSRLREAVRVARETARRSRSRIDASGRSIADAESVIDRSPEAQLAAKAEPSDPAMSDVAPSRSRPPNRQGSGD